MKREALELIASGDRDLMVKFLHEHGHPDIRTNCVLPVRAMRLVARVALGMDLEKTAFDTSESAWDAFVDYGAELDEGDQ